LDAGDVNGSRIVSDYGSQVRQRTDHSENRLLYPAGSTYVRRIGTRDDGDASEIWVTHHLVDVGRYGLPNVFSCGLAVGPREDLNELCERLPFESVDEAVAFFERELAQAQPVQISHMLGGFDAANAFGLAVLPSSLAKLTARPNPTSSELSNAASEIGEAAKQLDAALSKWADSDAFRFVDLYHRYIGGARMSLPRTMTEVQRTMTGLEVLKGEFSGQGRKVGRPIRGGREQLIALTIGRLWKRCNLGKVSFVPQSRFVRACAVILPWHGIHKSDVAQFMRAELSKRREGGVVIG
jgi:hypothetical protein